MVSILSHKWNVFGVNLANVFSHPTCLFCQHNDINEIEKQLNKDFESICDWLSDNKLSIHFNNGKTIFILFATKFKIKNAGKLNMKYGDIQIKFDSDFCIIAIIFISMLNNVNNNNNNNNNNSKKNI